MVVVRRQDLLLVSNTKFQIAYLNVPDSPEPCECFAVSGSTSAVEAEFVRTACFCVPFSKASKMSALHQGGIDNESLRRLEAPSESTDMVNVVWAFSLDRLLCSCSKNIHQYSCNCGKRINVLLQPQFANRILQIFVNLNQ